MKEAPIKRARDECHGGFSAPWQARREGYDGRRDSRVSRAGTLLERREENGRERADEWGGRRRRESEKGEGRITKMGYRDVERKRREGGGR